MNTPVNLSASIMVENDFNSDGATRTYATRELNMTTTDTEAEAEAEAEKVHVPAQKRRKNFKHVKHNSLVDFSFIMEQSSTNSLTLTHLNALFEILADRSSMGISAKKLYRLILTTDLNKYKIELYRSKLGIQSVDEDGEETPVSNDSSNSSGSGSGSPMGESKERIVSRGPFIAMFKHEKIAFVNSLETAARSISARKKKRKNKKRRGGNCNSNASASSSCELSTVKQSVKTAPVRGTNGGSSFDMVLDKGRGGTAAEDGIGKGNGFSNIDSRRDSEGPSKNSPKRKKIEDKTGMIIVAEIDHDEISAVSVSPTSETSSLVSGETPKMLSLVGSPFLASTLDEVRSRDSRSKKMTRRDRGSRSSRKHSRKDKRSKKRSSNTLRSIKSVGGGSKSVNSHDDDEDDDTSSCSKSLFSQTIDRGTSSISMRDGDKDDVTQDGMTHERSPSHEEAIDIRLVMNDSFNYEQNSQFLQNRHHHHSSHNHNFAQNDHRSTGKYQYMHQHHTQQAGGYMTTPMHMNMHLQNPPYNNGSSLFHPSQQMMFSHPHHPLSHSAHQRAHVHPYHDGNSYNNDHWQQPYSYSNVYADGIREDNIEYEECFLKECFLFKGFAAVVKNVFNFNKQKEVLLDNSDPEVMAQVQSWEQSSSLRNRTQPTTDQHQHSRDTNVSPIIAPVRARSRSRVFSDTGDVEKAFVGESVSSDQTTSISDMSSPMSGSTHLSSPSLSTDPPATKIERVLSFQIQPESEEPIYNRRRLNSCPEQTGGKKDRRVKNQKIKSQGLSSRKKIQGPSDGNRERANSGSSQSSSRSSGKNRKLKERSQNERQRSSKQTSQRPSSKKRLLEGPRPSSIAGISRSKTDGISIPRPSMKRSSLSRSSSAGSAENGQRCGTKRNYHYR
mmetsp:Transcript_23965/g.35652  ORF Transcript_23965/g.35652 Transcript_23965/m.35652 type:complete len:894 (-) Transcript_23965:164-2845(-)|eukprot:CAMPEP_0194076518 /NCGR_PEP_ID=MMETSP0149-20130528/3313_1 /TAXON_ID=122233 /ORGANISM="Chaetoceros debilis, Strain MM31A-1" /LENGTH=893 /DNA_ID=CAMNT_0038757287 /DNA_START=192 /DNA_END=2873 /DNA_ORIENTATION=+